MDNAFKRSTNNMLVNSDVSGYAAAKIRKNKEQEYANLLLKVEKLETCVDNLKRRIEEIENNGN